MSYFDSDEESNYEVGDVQLGFVDIEIPSDPKTEDDVPTVEDTFIGGTPVWLHPESVPDEKMVTCDHCGKKMALYLQTFAPFGNELYDRVIYVFGCKETRQCSGKKGSIKCIRGICKDPVKIAEIKQKQQDEIQKQLDEKLRLEDKKQLREELTKDLFKKDDSKKDDSANPFAAGNPFSNPFGNNPFENKPKESEKEDKKQQKSYASVVGKPKASKTVNKAYQLPEYPGFFVYLEREKLEKVTMEPELEKYKDLIDSNSINEEDEGPSKPLNPQAEKVSQMLEDKAFESFSNQVQHNPSQVLRYELGGKPLLYNGKDDVFVKISNDLIPKPAYNPSSSRQFELQLMPKAIMDLEDTADADIQAILGGMAWGTIIVYTDVEDYIPSEFYDANHVGYIEEYCGVQWEESV